MLTSKLTTSKDIEKELLLEEESIQMGIQKYRDALQADGVGNLPPGKQLIKAAMQPMVEAIEGWKKVTAEGLASRNAAAFYFLEPIDAEVIAWVTANACLSRLHEAPKVVSLASHIAMRLEGTVNMDAIAKANPRMATKIANRIEKMDADRNRLVFIRKGGQMVDAKVVQWDDVVRVRLGTLLVEMFAQATGLIVVETAVRGKDTKAMHIRPSESCRKWLEESNARCELLNPVRLPMVCMPRHWTTPFNGGYLSKALRQPLVKTRNNGYLSALKDWDMPWVYAAVNALQDTEWAVNEGVYAVAKELWEASRTDGGIPERQDAPLPSRSWNEGECPDDATLHAWKVAAAKTYEANAKLTSKRVQLVQKLWVAEKMMELGNRFHFVYNLDWRGRIYPVAPSLSPQGDDISKALLRFSHGEKLGQDGAYWLAIHGANSFGVDKVSFDERIAWVEENTERILEAAQCPTTGTMWWCEADSPFVFLAFCQEWAKLHAGLNQEEFVSYLAVAFDGACNGLQNFSAMLRDPVGGKATGLVPGERPADIYSQVAQRSQSIIDKDAAGGMEVAQRWVGKMTRKLAKRNTMTVPYGVTKRGMKDQLFQELVEVDSKHRAEDATYLAAVNYEAIGDVVVAARLAMDWLKEAAKVAASNQLPVRWVTPAGFLVVQDYREELGERMDFTVLGRNYRLTIQRTGDKLNSRKQALGISPNYVHSLDAAHLMRTVMFCAADGMRDFAMIHDSYGCHAGKASLLRDNLRQAFVEQYSGDVLKKFRDELADQLPEELRGELPELPPMGDLELSQVLQSEYFFA
jgi:DNA-directed RNA polymerase